MGKTSWLALPLGLAATVAMADGGIADMFSYSGFGTAGVLRTDTNQAEYIRTGQTAGATEGLYFKTDTNIGLQGTFAPTDWISGTVQWLAVDRFNDSLSPKVEWAYVKVKPLADLSIRTGQLAMAPFLISDSRYVGYANTWVRPPDEVYGQVPFDTYKGADIAYQYKIAKYLLTVGAMAGKTDTPALSGTTAVYLIGRNLRGYYSTLDANLVLFRASYVKLDLDASIGPYIVSNTGWSFTSFGATSDHDNVLLQGEFTRRHTGETEYDNNGWYMLGGYHFGKVLPYSIYAANQQPPGPSSPPTPPMYLPGLSKHTVSVGLRFDLVQSLDFKLQADHETTFSNGSPFINVQPGFHGSANVFTLAVDFVF